MQQIGCIIFAISMAVLCLKVSEGKTLYLVIQWITSETASEKNQSEEWAGMQ